MESGETTFKYRSPFIWSGIFGFCLFMLIKHFVETKSQNVRHATSYFKLQTVKHCLQFRNLLI